ncbi:hypothetical protein Sta7437_2211 [Stanieria cyanosphaera PCC 7437]|uniref:Uncharacterized protein n=1 Tax=Stanieria cyanosphaera (strain ATCC 29371 / PCC 7437) TaxID=111780 RepID=K9XUM0_STAC7|nr:hypothetical protein [Stanieria cyanosphaera]AFZ35759.1 hypothetical protein Sta7437_2211 [Stanieria cyanosphaera PCC 7437]
MGNIKLSELCPAGSEFFQDSESFLKDLNEQEVSVIVGGEGLVTGIVTQIISQANGSIASQASISGGQITVSVGATVVGYF